MKIKSNNFAYSEHGKSIIDLYLVTEVNKQLYFICDIYFGRYPPYLVISDQEYRAVDRLCLSNTTTTTTNNNNNNILMELFTATGKLKIFFDN
jgi:hypothetical protein